MPESSARAEVAAQARARVAAHAAFLADFLDGTDAPLTLELGCGHGHFLTAYAAAHPGAICLGADLISYRIERANRKKRLAHLSNVAFLKAEAFELLAALPAARKLERVFILFADPWPKRRHHNRRLFRTQTLDALAAHAAENASLCFRTDDGAFFADARACLAAHPLWRETREPWPFEAPSIFQEIHPVYQSLTARLRGASAE